MKKSFIIVVLLGLFMGCSPEDEQFREAEQACDCIVTTTVLENNADDATILSTSLESVEDSCDNDNNFTRTENSDGTVTEVSWSCSPK